jgi:hypothetical protein
MGGLENEGDIGCARLCPTLNRDNVPFAISNGITTGPQILYGDIHKCVPGFVHASIKMASNEIPTTLRLQSSRD